MSLDNQPNTESRKEERQSEGSMENKEESGFSTVSMLVEKICTISYNTGAKIQEGLQKGFSAILLWSKKMAISSKGFSTSFIKGLKNLAKKQQTIFPCHLENWLRQLP